MRSILKVSVALLFLAGCKSTTVPNAANFTKALNDYFAQHGEVCTAIGRQFPMDVPVRESDGIGSQLAVLKRAGLVNTTDSTAVVHGILDPLRGPTPPQPVKRYEPTAEGKKYFESMPGTLGATTGFCY